MSQFPALPWFCADFFAKTDHLTNPEQWAYAKLLMKTWVRNCRPFPDVDSDLCRVLGMSLKQWRAIKPRIIGFFDLSEGTWRQKRLEEEFLFVTARRESSRANGSLGGRPLSSKINDVKNLGVSKSITQSKANRNQATLTLIEESPDGDSLSTLPLGDKDVPQLMFDIWVEVCGHISMPQKLSPTRRGHLKARYRDTFGKSLDQWRAFCGRVAASPYLRGEVRATFRADLAWVINPENALKILEGRYDDRQLAGTGQPQDPTQRNRQGDSPLFAAVDIVRAARRVRGPG